MFTRKHLLSFVLGAFAMVVVMGYSNATKADRYDDPTAFDTEVIEPVDSSENHAIVTLDFA